MLPSDLNRYSMRMGMIWRVTSLMPASRIYRLPYKADTLVGRWVLFKLMSIVLTIRSAVDESYVEWENIGLEFNYIVNCLWPQRHKTSMRRWASRQEQAGRLLRTSNIGKQPQRLPLSRSLVLVTIRQLSVHGNIGTISLLPRKLLGTSYIFIQMETALELRYKQNKKHKIRCLRLVK